MAGASKSNSNKSDRLVDFFPSIYCQTTRTIEILILTISRARAHSHQSDSTSGKQIARLCLVPVTNELASRWHWIIVLSAPKLTQFVSDDLDHSIIELAVGGCSARNLKIKLPQIVSFDVWWDAAEYVSLNKNKKTKRRPTNKSKNYIKYLFIIFGFSGKMFYKRQHVAVRAFWISRFSWKLLPISFSVRYWWHMNWFFFFALNASNACVEPLRTHTPWQTE